MLRFDDFMAVGERERVVRVLLVNDDHRSGVNEEVLVGHFHICCVEIPECLVDFRRDIVRVPEIAGLLADVDKEDRVVGLENLEALRFGNLLDLKRRDVFELF